MPARVSPSKFASVFVLQCRQQPVDGQTGIKEANRQLSSRAKPTRGAAPSGGEGDDLLHDLLVK
jgi:hypothetical protein